MLGPREIGQEGFREGKVVETAMAMMLSVAAELSAEIAVFVAPPDFPCNRANKTIVKDFLTSTRQKFKTVVFDPGSLWDPDEAESVLGADQILVARDPINQGLSKKKRAYYRLPGPAGHKSRYEDPAIDRLAEIAAAAKHAEATYLFTNVDMVADAKRFRKAMKL